MPCSTPVPINYAAMSPDGQTLACVGDSCEAYLYSITPTGAPKALTSGVLWVPALGTGTRGPAVGFLQNSDMHQQPHGRDIADEEIALLLLLLQAANKRSHVGMGGRVSSRGFRMNAFLALRLLLLHIMHLCVCMSYKLHQLLQKMASREPGCCWT